MTVKEFFDTGLLNEVPVVYMGTISSKVVLCCPYYLFIYLWIYGFCSLFLLLLNLNVVCSLRLNISAQSKESLFEVAMLDYV